VNDTRRQDVIVLAHVLPRGERAPGIAFDLEPLRNLFGRQIRIAARVAPDRDKGDPDS
jgi:hypothetical protein